MNAEDLKSSITSYFISLGYEIVYIKIKNSIVEISAKEPGSKKVIVSSFNLSKGSFNGKPLVGETK